MVKPMEVKVTSRDYHTLDCTNLACRHNNLYTFKNDWGCNLHDIRIGNEGQCTDFSELPKEDQYGYVKPKEESG